MSKLVSNDIFILYSIWSNGSSVLGDSVVVLDVIAVVGVLVAVGPAHNPSGDPEEGGACGAVVAVEPPPKEPFSPSAPPESFRWRASGALVDVVGLGVVAPPPGACGALVDVVGLGVVVTVAHKGPPPPGPRRGCEGGACGALVDVVGLGVLVTVAHKGGACGALVDVV